MQKDREPEKVEFTTTTQEIGLWSSYQPTSKPVTSTTLMRELTRFATMDPPTTADLAALREKIASQPPLSDSISIYRRKDGTQTRGVMAASATVGGGKVGFEKNSLFSQPIAEYSGAKFKDL
jgi:hypothetical protein